MLNSGPEHRAARIVDSFPRLHSKEESK